VVYGWFGDHQPTDIYLWGWFHPAFNTAGVETIAYNALEAQILADAPLMAYVNNVWRGDTKPRILRNSDCPLILFFPHRVIDEKFIAVPMNKLTTYEQEIHGKVWIDNPEQMESEKIHLGELICDAIEKDLHLGEAATRASIVRTAYRQLSDRICEVVVSVEVVTRNFYAPLRQAVGFTRTI
jgi:hypothetical protein